MNASGQKIALAGDIGGTKTDLGLFAPGEKRPRMLAMETYPSPRASGLPELIKKFLDAHPQTVSSACFGVAGPVINGRSKVTNLTWAVSEEEIKRQFNWDKVRLVNDLAATAMGVPLLNSDELRTLNKGSSVPGNIGVVAPGTGLGIGFLVALDGGKFQAIASEGGHADFAPKNKDELDLLIHLQKKYGHVSLERILSGPGIRDIYSWLKERDHPEEPTWFIEKMKTEDPAAVISEAALVRKLGPCVKTLKMFVSILAATAGNLALTGMTTGGMYIGGGISPKILPIFNETNFMESFTAKGRFGELLSKVPAHIILNDQTALLGAAWRGLEDLR